MALDYYLDRKVIFSEESEHKSLNRWFLQEHDAEGKAIGQPQIPWPWSLVFSATEVELSETLSFETRLVKNDEEKLEIETKRRIHAKLRPGYVNNPERGERYSMFGTAREIKSFELWIYEAEEGKEESARAWGTLSFTSEVDFRYETMEDTLQFLLTVTPERFRHYADIIGRFPSNVLSLRVGIVQGLYSGWSRSISTHEVKVLTNVEDHKVILPENPPFQPPSLGKVGHFALTFITRREFDKPAALHNGYEVPEKDRPRTPDEENILIQQTGLKLALSNAARLKQLIFAAWAIALLLLLILVK